VRAVLAAPREGLEPPDIVRLAGRARKERKRFMTCWQLPQGELPFDASAAAIGTLAEFYGATKKPRGGATRRDFGDLTRNRQEMTCTRGKTEICAATSGILTDVARA